MWRDVRLCFMLLPIWTSGVDHVMGSGAFAAEPEPTLRSIKTAQPVANPARPRPSVAEETARGPRLDYVVISQSLEGLADGLSRAIGQRIVAEGQLDRPLRDLRLSGSVEDVLTALSATRGLLWWTDGSRWRLAAPGTAENRRLQLGEMSAGDARALVARTFPSHSPGLIAVEPESRSIIVRGPKSLVDELDTAIKAAKTAPGAGITVIRFGRMGN
jgi:hypothetical protein